MEYQFVLDPFGTYHSFWKAHGQIIYLESQIILILYSAYILLLNSCRLLNLKIKLIKIRLMVMSNYDLCGLQDEVPQNCRIFLELQLISQKLITSRSGRKQCPFMPQCLCFLHSPKLSSKENKKCKSKSKSSFYFRLFTI